MANFALLQVARYSALGFGIIYGVYHQATLSSSAKLAATKREYEHKQKLIDQAKAAYTQKNAPPSKSENGGGTFDPTHTLDCQIASTTWGIVTALCDAGFE
jgi:F-type H+-transporting ATP synthase subunit e